MNLFSVESSEYKKETTAKKKLEYPQQIILIGGGTGWHFTDRPFAAHFGYTPIYKSISTFKLEGALVEINNFSLENNTLNLGVKLC